MKFREDKYTELTKNVGGKSEENRIVDLEKFQNFKKGNFGKLNISTTAVDKNIQKLKRIGILE